MKQIILTPNAPSPIGAYSQAVKHNGILYISGQIAIDPSTNKLVFDGIKKETTLIMENGDAIALTPQNRNIERSIKYYVGNNNWYWSDEAHPMESNAPAVSFMPYYFLNGRYAVCLRVESIYPEIAEKPFLIFKRID